MSGAGIILARMCYTLRLIWVERSATSEPDIRLFYDPNGSWYAISLTAGVRVQRGKRHQAQCAWSRATSIFVP